MPHCCQRKHPFPLLLAHDDFKMFLHFFSVSRYRLILSASNSDDVIAVSCVHNPVLKVIPALVKILSLL